MDTEKINDCINTLLFNKGELKSQEAKDIIDVLYGYVKVGQKPNSEYIQPNATFDEMFNYPSSGYVRGHHYDIYKQFSKETIETMFREISDLTESLNDEALSFTEKEGILSRTHELSLKLKIDAYARNSKRELQKNKELINELIDVKHKYYIMYLEERKKNSNKNCWFW